MWNPSAEEIGATVSIAFLLASRHCGLGHSYIRCILANISRDIESLGIIHLLN